MRPEKWLKSNVNENSIQLSNNKKLLITPKRASILGVLAFLFCTSASITLYSNYNFFFQYLSELGIGSTRLIFNSGIIIGALLLVPLFASYYIPNSFRKQLTALLGIISLAFFIGIAIFPLSIPKTHFTTTLLFFFTMLITIILSITDFLLETKSVQGKNKTDLFRKLDKIVFTLISLVSVISIICFYFFMNPLWQKIAVGGILVWIVMIIILRKNENWF
ncbi:MAG: DUF998 domain-containing protein [Candidatus Diapherotrites archaeon]|nr:DUF998 domain-containing protein [Candidatus Diapherotrites archaeon]